MKILEAKDYSHLDVLLDNVIQVRHTPDKLDMNKLEQPHHIPLSKQPPKQEVIDAHITRFSKHSKNN